MFAAEAILMILGALWGTLIFLQEEPALAIVLLALGIVPGIVGACYATKSRGAIICLMSGFVLMMGGLALGL